MKTVKPITLRRVHNALRRVATKLRNGTITAKDFDMNVPMVERYAKGHQCGTTGCIGGWMAIELGAVGTAVSHAMQVAQDLDWSLHAMFYEFGEHKKITRAAGARAIDRYFEGKPAWPEVKVH